MAVKWERIDNTKVKMEIEVEAPEVDIALARAYREVVKKINLPGFRKGKVPRRVLEARFGPEILYEKAAEIMVPAAYEKAIAEAQLEPITQPEFELVQLKKGEPFLFNVQVEVLPPVELGEYRGVEVEEEKVEITEDKIDKHIEFLREQHARLVAVPEGSVAENGDLVIIDFTGYLDGEPFPEGEAENYSLELGSGTFIPGFEEQLVGAAEGEEREVKVKYPDDYSKKELAGKEALFKVKVKQIKRKELPEFNDDFVKEISECDTVEEFRSFARKRMEESARERARRKLEEDLIRKVADVSQVELPRVLVERQLDRIMGEMEQYLRFQGLNLEKYAELTGKSVEELREENKEEAERRTKANLVLDAIIKKEGIDVEESELDDKIAEIAKLYQDKPERVKEVFEKQGRLALLKEEIRMRKVIDLLVNEAKIKTAE